MASNVVISKIPQPFHKLNDHVNDLDDLAKTHNSRVENDSIPKTQVLTVGLSTKLDHTVLESVVEVVHDSQSPHFEVY